VPYLRRIAGQRETQKGGVTMNLRRMSSRLPAILLAGIGAGCARDAGRETAGPPASRPATTRAEGLRSELVYTRTGGFVGTSDRVAVQPDGRLDATGRMLGQHVGQLSAAQLAELAGLLQNWPRIEVRGQPPRGAADYFQLSITYAGKTVTWTSLTPDVPPALTRLSQRIEELARSVK